MTAFQYDKYNQCFSMELNNMLFSCEKDPVSFEPAAQRLARQYQTRLPFIAEYIVGDEEFRAVYGEMSVEDFLVMLREEMTIPWIFLRENNSGTVAYSTSAYIIEFVFQGDFEKFSELFIDG